MAYSSSQPLTRPKGPMIPMMVNGQPYNKNTNHMALVEDEQWVKPPGLPDFSNIVINANERRELLSIATENEEYEESDLDIHGASSGVMSKTAFINRPQLSKGILGDIQSGLIESIKKNRTEKTDFKVSMAELIDATLQWLHDKDKLSILHDLKASSKSNDYWDGYIRGLKDQHAFMISNAHVGLLDNLDTLSAELKVTSDELKNNTKDVEKLADELMQNMVIISDATSNLSSGADKLKYMIDTTDTLLKTQSSLSSTKLAAAPRASPGAIGIPSNISTPIVIGQQKITSLEGKLHSIGVGQQNRSKMIPWVIQMDSAGQDIMTKIFKCNDDNDLLGVLTMYGYTF